MAFERLKKDSEYRTVYKKGKSTADANLVMYILKKDQGEEKRFGFTISKKIGKAVVRNRIRRILKEVCRLNEGKLSGSFDMILVARTPVVDKSYQQIESSFLCLAQRSRLIR